MIKLVSTEIDDILKSIKIIPIKCLIYFMKKTKDELLPPDLADANGYLLFNDITRRMALPKRQKQRR